MAASSRTSSIQGFKPEGKLKIDYKERKVKLAGGESVTLRAPSYALRDLAYGPISPDMMISPRVAPPMIGLGLLEAVPEEQILANADPDDADKDGISGKPNHVWSREHGKVMLGRFGWKAGVPTIAQQAAEAFNGDIGLSTTMIPNGSGDCTEKEKDCLDAPNGNSPKYQNVEVGDELFKLVVFYSQNLAVPARRKPDDAQVLKGKELFYKIGLRGLPQAEIHDRRGVRPAASVASAHLSLYRYAAARHGRGACRQSRPRVRRAGTSGARRRSGASG